MDWIQAGFQNVLRFNDQKIEQICYEHYRMRAYPLLVHIEYLKWKESLIIYQIQAAVEQIKYQKDKQLAKERADYATKTDQAKAKTIQEVTGLRNDNMQLMVHSNEWTRNSSKNARKIQTFEKTT